MKSTIQTAADTPSVIRPYTSYNLFFQLEREYLLQTKLGHKPNIKKLFNPKDKSNYQGPPLPPRYASLILPYDWHIPGKEKRRKRSHRKSHGILGFHEMNRQVSSNWKTIDSTTRKFCKSLADMEAVKFKKNKKNTPTMKRKYNVKSNKNTLGKSILATITHEQKVAQWIQSTKNNNQPSNDNDMLVDDVWDNVCASVDVDFLNDDFFGFTSNSSSDDIMSQVTSSTTSGSSSCSDDSIISTVDISDDDIITLWKDTTVQEETAVDKVRVVSPTKQQDQKKRMSLLTTPKRKTMAACKA